MVCIPAIEPSQTA